ncbi:MAG: RnfABCDGE type electron transport complex subunit D [Phycisphaerae bacterium]|nr:RnfABCDGE type electron transport complex subunit D [Phycisphaerae bacterium]
MTANDWAMTRLPSEPGPYLHSGLSASYISRVFLVATTPLVLASLILFGKAAAEILLLSIVGGVIGEAIALYMMPGNFRPNMTHAVLTGVLVGLTLPATVSWYVAFTGGFIALSVGKGLLGGFGNYVWHPALVGRAVVQLLFGAQLAPRCWPVLVPESLGSGSIGAAAEAVYYRGYQWSHPPCGVEAWALRRPIDRLLDCYGWVFADGGVSSSGWFGMFRDQLPPWGDTLWGTVGGGIGETCTVALVLGGLYLLYRGFLHWRSVIGLLFTVMVLAAVLPIRLDGEYVWCPLFSVPQQFPAGIALVLFHLTGGGLLLSCLILAADPMTTPLSRRGHVIFGIGVGVFTMAARWFGLTPGSSYWAILAMNTLVPLIDRLNGKGRG